ncbi:MAG: hypothetical protein U9N61_09505 [Euryarchaeota archaeon]|nr:hypothetical protein [Euryarchaeota archaeon]
MQWPLGPNPTPRELLLIYNDGFPGAPVNPIERDSLFADGLVKTADHIQHLVLQNPGNGKRALLFRSREQFDPGAFGKENQTDGDCTSHGDRNTRDTARCVEIHVKGEPERYKGRGATEPTYGFRGHSGAGMDPGRAARFVTEYGFMIRQNYSGCVDLSQYNSSVGSRWGRSGPPSCVLEQCKEHPVGEYVTPNDPDEAMALFHNGYPCHSGQNIGFDSTPNSRGYHDRQGSWNHDMATVGYDDTCKIWPVRVYFVVNSWGKWNSQWSKWENDSELQRILGPPITGMMTVHHEVWERYFLGGQSIYFYSDIKGYPMQKLPDYGTGTFL